ncbi:hypothetical protein HC776_00510, partial [bacterium]|nr:hypothetical protein [bacterium]
VQFLPDSPLIVSGSDDRSLRLWNRDNGFLMYRYEAHTGRLIDVFTHNDGRILVSAGADGRVFFWTLPPRLEEMVAWARENRYVRPLTCAETNLYLGEDQDCTVVTTTE